MNFLLLGTTLVALGLLTGQAATGQTIKSKPLHPADKSPPYIVAVMLRYSSPFVPDGRMSLAEFAFSVKFSPVIFEFDPRTNDADSRWCSVDAEEGKGTISDCLLNDVEPESPRHKAWFTKGPPKEFAAVLDIAPSGISQEGLGPGQLKPVLLAPPEKLTMAFRTKFWLTPTEWQSNEGSVILAEHEVEFEVPFARLIKGRRYSLNLPYNGSFPEDKGKWWIEFLPEKGKAGSLELRRLGTETGLKRREL